MSIACGCTNIQVPTGERGATGPTGATGAAGTNGTNGVALLANQYPGLSTLGTSFESLAEGRTPYVLAANTLSTNGDAILITATFTSNSTTGSKFPRITFNSSPVTGTIVPFYASVTKIDLIVKLTRISNTTAKYECKQLYYTTGFGSYIQDSCQTITPVNLAGLNFTTTAYNIDAQGDSAVIGDITCQTFEILKYKI